MSSPASASQPRFRDARWRSCRSPGAVIHVTCRRARLYRFGDRARDHGGAADGRTADEENHPDDNRTHRAGCTALAATRARPGGDGDCGRRSRGEFDSRGSREDLDVDKATYRRLVAALRRKRRNASEFTHKAAVFTLRAMRSSRWRRSAPTRSWMLTTASRRGPRDGGADLSPTAPARAARWTRTGASFECLPFQSIRYSRQALLAGINCAKRI